MTLYCIIRIIWRDTIIFISLNFIRFYLKFMYLFLTDHGDRVEG